jgi:hypothetical protein
MILDIKVNMLECNICSSFTVTVDYKVIQMPSISVYLIDRGSAFVEMCDSIDGAIQELSVTCFNNNGKPTLKKS